MKIIISTEQSLNMLGAVTAIAILVLMIMVFVFRLAKQPVTEHITGIIFLLAAVPLVYLLIQSAHLQRPGIYYVQIVLMLAFIVVELLLDYIFKLEFRQTRWIVILYVMLFFASTGGMIGVASHAGHIWTYTAIGLFLIMAFLTFYQRAKTGM